MRINSIQNIYQNNNINFQGTVDKSVVKFFKEFQADAVRDKAPYWTNGQIDALEKNLQSLLNKLKDFMAKTHAATKLAIISDIANRNFKVYNNDLGARKTIETILNYTSKYGLHNIKSRRNGYGDIQYHKYDDFKHLQAWVDEFVEQDPKELDKQLYDNFIRQAEDNALNRGAIYRHLITENIIKKAKKYAQDFGYKEAPLDRVYLNMQTDKETVEKMKAADKVRNDKIKSLKSINIK